jgi:hypothetical protein
MQCSTQSVSNFGLGAALRRCSAQFCLSRWADADLDDGGQPGADIRSVEVIPLKMQTCEYQRAL